MQPIASWKLAVPLGMIRAFIMSTSSVNTAMSRRQTPQKHNITFPPAITLCGSSFGHASKFALCDRLARLCVQFRNQVRIIILLLNYYIIYVAPLKLVSQGTYTENRQMMKTKTNLHNKRIK